MKTIIKVNLVIAVLLCLTSVSYGRYGTIWNFHDGFSCSANPSGPWSYHEGYSNYPSGGAKLVKLGTATLLCNAPQCTWHRPIFNDCLINLERCIEGAEPNDFLNFGPIAIMWTAPTSGSFRLTGSLMQSDQPTRQLRYTIAFKGQVLETGQMLWSGQTLVGPQNRISFHNGTELEFNANIGEKLVLTIDANAAHGNGSCTYAYATLVIKEFIPCVIPQGDMNNDCKVDLKDFALVAENWLIDCKLNPSAPECLN